jgi:hypothetical protein
MSDTDAGTGHADRTEQPAERAYTEWRCTNCGNSVPKHNPPCNRCGNMEFEQVRVSEHDFDEEIRGPSNLELLRDNWATVGASVVIVLVVVVGGLASAGVFVVSDPFGLGYRYGAVEATAPDADGTLTAAEFHGQVASEYDETSLGWSGRTLELSYASEASSNAALADELTQVAVWYASYVEDGGDAERLQVTARVGDGRARIVVDSADARAFAAGDITESEYRSRLFESDDS